MIKRVSALIRIWRNPRKDPKQIRKMQDRKLVELVSYAYKWVPYYRELFDKNGIDSRQIRSVDDLVRLPILDKVTAKNEVDRLMSPEFNRSDLIRRATGGSTGTPLVVYKSPDFSALENAAKFRAYLQNGYKLHYKIAVAQHMAPKARLFHKFGIHREYNIPYSDSIAEQVDRISQLRAEVIDAQPNRLELISRYLISSRRSLDHVKLIFSHSEKLTTWQRELVNSVFHLDPIDCYGCTESSQIAAQCSARNGYHINSDLVILELLPKDEGLPDESMRRVVITNLGNRAMPLIRYEVGDLAVSTEDRCSCGNNFPLLAEIAGRTNDLIVLPNGEQISGFVLARAIEECEEVLEYRVIQRRNGEIDIYLVLVAGAESPVRRLREKTALDFPELLVTFNRSDEIPLSSRGKLCRVESELLS